MTEVFNKFGKQGHEWVLRVARGDFENIKYIPIVGINRDLDGAEDIINHGGTLAHPTTAETWYISSDNAGDDKQIVVNGLDADYNRQTGIATLNGQTQVEVKSISGASQKWIRFFCIENYNGDATAGDFYVGPSGSSGGVPTTVRGHAEQATQRSWYAAYTVPAGWTGFVKHLRGAMSASLNATMEMYFKAALFEKYLFPRYPLYLDSKAGIQDIELHIPYALPEKTDIMVSGLNPSTTNISCMASASLIIVRNE